MNTTFQEPLLGRKNYVLQLNEHDFVSYNPETGGNPLNDLCARLTGNKDSGAETALCVNDIWYILEGDFREQYEAVAPDVAACLRVYRENIKHRSNWSTDSL